MTQRGTIVEPSSTAIEPKATRDADAVLDEVFLTPRVVDHAAFVEYAEGLERLIRDASAEARRLGDAKSDIASTVDATGRAGRELAKKLELASKILGAIDQRAKQAEGALARADERLAKAEALEARIDQLIAERAGAVEQRITASIKGASERAEETERRLLAAERQARSTAANAAAAIAQLEDRLASIQARAEAVAEQSDLARQAMDVKIAEVTRLVDQRAGVLVDKFETMEDLGARVFAALGVNPDDPRAGASDVIERIERAEQASARAERIAAQLEQLSERAERASAGFDDRLSDASVKMDELDARHAELVGPLHEAYEDIASSVPLLTETIRSAGSQIEELASMREALRQSIQDSTQLAGEAREQLQNRADQLKALLDGSLHRLSSRVEEAGGWLGGLIQRAEQTGAALDAQCAAAERGTPAGAPRADALPEQASDQVLDPRPPHSPIDAQDFSGSDRVIPTWRPRENPDDAPPLP